MRKKHRKVYRIASDIANDWGVNTTDEARPYLAAMLKLNTVADMRGNFRGSSIVKSFLSAARPYQGEKANTLKNELRALLRSDRRKKKNA